VVGVQCGKSGAVDTIPVVRKTDDFVFREWKCVSSGASLSSGTEEGWNRTLSARDKKDGEWLEDNLGWQTWGLSGKRRCSQTNSGGKADGRLE